MDVDVVVVGGGATGCGVAWDLSLRGLAVTVVEKTDIAGGTSGRFHGLLHSGARYVVTDPATAGECWRESRVLRRIAPAAIDETGGLHVQGTTHGESFVESWTAACRRVGIPVTELSPEEALRREPGLDPALRRAFLVPDAVCRSPDLCASLRRSAESRGARFLTFHRLSGFERDGSGLRGVQVTDVRSGSRAALSCRIVVNAAGPWSGRVADMAGVPLRMSLVRGAMLAFEGRLVGTVVSALQSPDEGDIILPRGRVSIAGTTAVATEDPDDRRVDSAEVTRVTCRIKSLVPGIDGARLVHAWSAVRPLYADNGQGMALAERDLWKLSRDYTVIDHAPANGVEGLVSIVGGKLTTFRLMAEKTSDTVCRKLGVSPACQTAVTPLEA